MSTHAGFSQLSTDRAKPLTAVIDDDARMLESLQDLLESVGYQVLLFASAEAFLLSTRADSVSCLITDIGLPGMDGSSLIIHLRKEQPVLSIIVITGRDTDQIRDACATAGMHAFFRKPFDPSQLIAAIREVRKERDRLFHVGNVDSDMIHPRHLHELRW